MTTIVVNLSTAGGQTREKNRDDVPSGVTTYEDYPFTSYAQIGGVVFGVGPQGLCRLDTEARSVIEVAVPVNASLKTGLMDFESVKRKRLLNVLLTNRSSAPTEITFRVDENNPVMISMDAPLNNNMSQRRAVVPRGLVGKLWQVEINNTLGGELDVGQILLDVAESTRRI